MAAYFCDSSALAKRYVAETGSAWLTATIDPKGGNYTFIARITFVEITSAISRKQRTGNLSASDFKTVQSQLETDYLSELLSVEITESLILEAAKLAEIHALRGYDAVQLAAALEIQAKRSARGLPALIMLSADHDLNHAAIIEGLTVENPNLHP
jgi:uncharacterized protein